jgi:hypothetical protein
MILKSEIIDAWFNSSPVPPTKEQSKLFADNFGISRVYVYDRLSKHYIRLLQSYEVKKAEKSMRKAKDFEKDIQHFTYDIEADIKHVNVDELYKQATR